MPPLFLRGIRQRISLSNEDTNHQNGDGYSRRKSHCIIRKIRNAKDRTDSPSQGARPHKQRPPLVSPVNGENIIVWAPNNTKSPLLGADQIRWLQKDVRCWIDISWSNFLSLLQLYYNDVREHKTQVDNCDKDASWLIKEDKESG